MEKKNVVIRRELPQAPPTASTHHAHLRPFTPAFPPVTGELSAVLRPSSSSRSTPQNSFPTQGISPAILPSLSRIILFSPSGILYKSTQTCCHFFILKNPSLDHISVKTKSDLVHPAQRVSSLSPYLEKGQHLLRPPQALHPLHSLCLSPAGIFILPSTLTGHASSGLCACGPLRRNNHSRLHQRGSVGLPA